MSIKLLWPVKDPDEVKDYQLLWEDALAGDTILTSAWSILPDDDTLVVDSDQHDDDTATVWLSAGDPGVTYDLLNRVVTAGGRSLDQTVQVKVRER